MRFIFAVSSILISIIGLIFIVRGSVHPSKYKEELSKETPTAVRVTQVYTEATHFVVIGIGIISFGILIAVIGMMFNWDEMTDRFLSILRKSQKTTEANDTVHNLTKEENDS
ncbi:hypothetical protein F4083_09725 [Candidatus Poribacteria bacterium]|nr:hypothetical protein [Candidatus Poribacteria bacterium]MYB63263.1 hypothetical protein [Candidatus Poribacteria bacterium]MYF55784.1 hypothetical protein [Candidatus Poribacteria bacterium]MYI94581.1 hypothetical protein [Candidatus Poribacteria bacterium]